MFEKGLIKTYIRLFGSETRYWHSAHARNVFPPRDSKEFLLPVRRSLEPAGKPVMVRAACDGEGQVNFDDRGGLPPSE